MGKQLAERAAVRVCSFKFISALALVLILTALPMFAQLPTGTILGVVRDSSGASVPDAKVSATNVDTNDVRTAATGSDGAFRLSALQPGHYNVKVEKDGFKTETQTSLNLDVAQELVVNTAMEVGASTQQVTVTGEAPLVNTTASSLSGLVNDEKMAELPLNGRNFVDLALLQPGVTNDTNFSGATAQNGTSGVMFSSNGAPIRSNTATLDGAPLMNIRGTTAGAIGTTLGVDGIKEYRVITDAFSAEYGLQMGSQVVIVSKGGTNQFHGDLFEYLRNNLLDARNFFDYSYLSTGKRVPELQRNNFGGSFGGPIKKDKTFFYGVYERLRQNMGATIIDNVFPSTCHVLTANPCAITAKNPAGNVVSVVQPFLALYPNPDIPNTNQFTYPAVNPSTVDYGQMRVDQNLSSTDSFFGRYTVQNSALTSHSAYPQVATLTAGRDQFFSLAENHIFSPTVLNQARASLSRTNIFTSGIYSQNLIGPQYSFNPGDPMGSLSIGTVTTFPSVSPASFLQNLYTLSDDVYYTKGRHAFKFGMLFNRFEDYDGNTTQTRGSISFASQASFLAGLPTALNGEQPGSQESKEFRFYTYGFYAQDDWRLDSRLTLNLGLRYEFNTTAFDRLGRNYAFVPSIVSATTTTPGPASVNPSLKNFSPRVGFAWDVTGKGKTSIRAAFGEYYDVGNSGYAMKGQSEALPPLSFQDSVSFPSTNTTPVSLPFTYGAPGNSGIHTNAYLIDQPHLLQWNMTVEQQLASSMVLAVSYVGTRGIHLWTSEEGNPCIPTSITAGIPFWGTDCGQGRPNKNFGSTNYETTNGDSWFNSLQAVLTKRLSHGLEVQGAYTYGKILDTTQGQFGGSECVSQGGASGVYPQDKREYDKGPACFNVAQNLRVSTLYHLPNFKADNAIERGLMNGWWVGTLVSWETGMPFTPMDNTWRSNSDHLVENASAGTETDHASLGTATVAPGAVGPDGTINATCPAPCANPAAFTFIPFNPKTVITGNPQQWFNPLMFSPGPVGFLGTAPRDMLEGPHLGDWDFSINKDTAAHFLGETGRIEARVEFFNILNHANFGMPNGVAYAGTLTDTSEFVEKPQSTAGVITNTVTSSRQIQLSLKILF